MSRYSRIKTRIWNSQNFRRLPDETKLFWLYLLTCPHGNLLGMFVLRPGYAKDDLKWSEKKCKKALKGLLNGFETVNDDGLVSYDETVHLILIKNYLKHNPLDNPNQVKAASRKLTELPLSRLTSEFKEMLEKNSKPLYKPLIKQLYELLGEPLPEGFDKPVTVTETVSVSVSGTETVTSTSTESDVESESKYNDYNKSQELAWRIIDALGFPRHQERAIFKLCRRYPFEAIYSAERAIKDKRLSGKPAKEEIAYFTKCVQKAAEEIAK